MQIGSTLKAIKEGIMKQLLMDDSEANRLIKSIKMVLKKHNKTLIDNVRDQITLQGPGDTKFILNYHFQEHKKIIHLRETKYNYTLLRINLNNSFHKNADGEKIYGNRINIFSEAEFKAKADGNTHYKCFKLPFDNISDSNDFLLVFFELLGYANVNNKDFIDFNIQTSII